MAAAIECGRGHLYDPDIYVSCPYCNSAQQAIQFGPPLGDPGRTAPLSGGYGPSQGFGGVPVGDAGKTAPLSGADAPPFASAPGVSVTSDGKTLPPRGFHSAKKVVEDNKTVGMMKEKLGIDPVVGWLVCVEGVERGKDYKLRGQINTIGRSERMDVCISGDKTISSENHARLSYSEKNNRFNLIPAESRNIIYLNGEEIFSATPLSPYDIIDFGETKLVFVPLCCDAFTWEAEEKKE